MVQAAYQTHGLASQALQPTAAHATSRQAHQRVAGMEHSVLCQLSILDIPIGTQLPEPLLSVSTLRQAFSRSLWVGQMYCLTILGSDLVGEVGQLADPSSR